MFFLQNNFGKVPKNNLIGIIATFYSEDELVEAKSLLFQTLENSGDGVADGRPRNKVRRGDTKRRLDSEDIVALMEWIDKTSVTLPTFGAVNLLRIPSMPASDVDVYRLAETVNEMKQQLSVLQSTLSTLLAEKESRELVSTEHASASPPQVSTGPCSSESTVTIEAATISPESATSAESTTFASLFLVKDENGEWFEQKRTAKKKSQTIRKITGSGKSNDFKIKAATTGEKKWHVFAGRLDPSTTAEELTAQLSEGGIRGVECIQLPRKEKWQEKFSAFHVLVDIDDKDTVFNETLWPFGVDIRDWWFKPRRQ